MFLAIFILILFFFQNPILAQKDFTITENIEYLINSQGNAIITHQVQITNNFSQIYPKEYQIDIQGLPLSDLSATDDQGNILTSFNTQNDLSQIKLKFNSPKLGKDRITNFKLSYRISQLAKNKGKTWEIALPQSTDSSLTKSQITLKTPLEFGGVSFSSIPSTLVSNSSQNIVTFQNNSRSKILIIFGNYQLFNFSLDYYLKNPSDSPIESQIALIPQTYSQAVFYQSISPPPQSISADIDGNWLASYQLQPNQELNIIATGQVKTGLNLPSKNDNLNSYLSEQPFWPVNSTDIQSIALNLNSPRHIYDYVVSTLNYDYERINRASRQGALLALQNPNNSLCTEFTDLFVTLARAKKIPAREIEGFAYSTNPKIKPTNVENDILHAWPEYYDQNSQAWKAIDPTWGKTTGGIDYFNDLDLNHITFVIHGQNSQLPPPPGAYKKPDGSKSVHIDFASEEVKSNITLPKIRLQKSEIIINNDSTNSQNNLSISVPQLKYTQNIPLIMPFSQLSLKIPSLSFWSSLSTKNQNLSITLQNNDGLSTTTEVKYLPHFLNLGLSLIAGIIILTISGIIITSKTHEKNS